MNLKNFSVGDIVRLTEAWTFVLAKDDQHKEGIGNITMADGEFMILSIGQNIKNHELLPNSEYTSIQVITTSGLKLGWICLELNREYGWQKVV